MYSICNHIVYDLDIIYYICIGYSNVILNIIHREMSDKTINE